jgi:hypothetical protein
MGIDVYVLNGRRYAEDVKNIVYRSSYTVHEEIIKKIPLLGEFVSMCDRPHKKIFPDRFIPFIDRFKEEMQKLEDEGRTQEEIHISGPHEGLGTYHEKIKGIVNGLQRAKELSKPISIDGLC